MNAYPPNAPSNDMSLQTFATISLPPSRGKPNDLRGIDSSFDNVSSLFGDDAVLVPVPSNGAGEMIVSYSDINLEQTRAVAYQSRLTRESIAVATGVNGIFAIHFPTDGARVDFLKANPQLRDSLITDGPMGSVVWLRSETKTATTIIPGCSSWLGVGAAVVVAGRRTMEAAFKILNTTKPVTTSFENIVWPEPMRVELVLRSLVRETGGATTLDPRNKAIPNWNFWARAFALILYVRYDLTREAFFQALPGQAVELLSDERALLICSDFLSEFGRQERFGILLKYGQPRYLKEFAAVVKIVTARTCEPEDDLEKFLVAVLEPCQGASVSTAELNEINMRYFRAKSLPPYPRTVFDKRLPTSISRLFHGLQSRKLQRGGKYCRGYKHVQIKPGDPCRLVETRLPNLSEVQC